MAALTATGSTKLLISLAAWPRNLSGPGFSLRHRRSENPFYRQLMIQGGGGSLCRLSAHQDGSCDDYFPYERAGGGGIFHLASVESYTCWLSNQPLRFFERRTG